MASRTRDIGVQHLRPHRCGAFGGSIDGREKGYAISHFYGGLATEVKKKNYIIPWQPLSLRKNKHMQYCGDAMSELNSNSNLPIIPSISSAAMKYILVCMFALFLLSSSAVMAQVQSGSTTTTVGGGGSDAAGTPQETYGEAIPSRVKTMSLSQALPMAKDLLNRKILLTGIVEGYCHHDCWITLMEGEARVNVHTGIDGLPTDLAGREISLYGWFEETTTDAGDAGFRFNAMSVRP